MLQSDPAVMMARQFPCTLRSISKAVLHVKLVMLQIGQEYQVGRFLVKPFKTYHTVPSQVGTAPGTTHFAQHCISVCLWTLAFTLSVLSRMGVSTDKDPQIQKGMLSKCTCTASWITKECQNAVSFTLLIQPTVVLMHPFNNNNNTNNNLPCW